MRSEIRKILDEGSSKYRAQQIRILGKNYNLHVYSEDEDLNLFEGLLMVEVEERSTVSNLISRYRAPVSGFVPRLSFILHSDQLLIRDYRRNRVIRKTIRRINKPFLSKLRRAILEPSENSFNGLFDRTDIIEEFYVLYRKARRYLLRKVKGISDKDKRTEFVDNFMMQMLTLWFLQERGFFDGDKSYFVSRFNDMKQKKLFDGVKTYHEFISYFFDKVCNHSESQYYEDHLIGKVVVLGPAVFLNGEYTSEAISIPDSCFYKEGMTETLISSRPKKVSDEVPLLNLLESRDWTEGNIDEYVLGAIYEKLITSLERKRLGAYYTPEEVTSYICENTIEPYLVSKLNEEFGRQFSSTTEAIEGGERDILLHLFHLLGEMKILDPAVGSAHFLESAINVLLVIYEGIWRKAKELGMGESFEILAADEKGEIETINLTEISDKEQMRLYVKFFMILSKNIYGVDVNPIALKVAKARLFLTLSKHFDVRKNTFIRFPNVHFNLREGNSLIGHSQFGREESKKQLILDLFAEEEAPRVMDAIKIVSELESYLVRVTRVLGIGGDMAREVAELNKLLSRKRIRANDLKKVMKTKEKLTRILIGSLNSQFARPLNDLLSEITDLFNRKLDESLAEERVIDLDKLMGFKTFHWAFEFPEVFLDREGFDVVIGNPPYVELHKVDYGHLLHRSKNLYDEFIRASLEMLHPDGMFGFIHANSAYCQPKYEALMTYLRDNTDNLIIINFAIRPQPVFKGVMQRTAITICRKHSGGERVRTSRYFRLTAENRVEILSNPEVFDSSQFAWIFNDFVPKIGNRLDSGIFEKIVSNDSRVENIIDTRGGDVYYHDSGESYWTKALDYEPVGIRDGLEVKARQWYKLKVKKDLRDFVICLLNSTLFYWFWLTTSDCRHLTKTTILRFPIPDRVPQSKKVRRESKRLSSLLMSCYRENSGYVEKRKGYQSLEFKVNRCKRLIDEIDRFVGGVYGLSEDEIEYLLSYDGEMRTEED